MAGAVATIGRSWYLWPAAVATYLVSRPPEQIEKGKQRPIIREKCVQALLAEDGARSVPSAGQMLRKHGIAGRLIAQDHWFDMMEGEAMVQDMVCVYNKKKREFHTVVRVGSDVCGYPRTVHGGLTAAIADETFGGLYVCLWTSGALGFKLPGLTAKLEVDYLRKLPADNLIICSTRLDTIERRKVWMSARVMDGSTFEECARARALFVAPRWTRTLRRLLPFAGPPRREAAASQEGLGGKAVSAP